jgi:hypothetical protein
MKTLGFLGGFTWMTLTWALNLNSRECGALFAVIGAMFIALCLLGYRTPNAPRSIPTDRLQTSDRDTESRYWKFKATTENPIHWARIRREATAAALARNGRVEAILVETGYDGWGGRNVIGDRGFRRPYHVWNLASGWQRYRGRVHVEVMIKVPVAATPASHVVPVEVQVTT